ncbi:hypothetical protein GQ42DRAFT_62160 [Ramicandelaber brevisporus]|nr:hypothetical protein GQ42DRAFT_62160 [Ramicandelaber brevisporus]
MLNFGIFGFGLGALKATLPALGGKAWRIPYRLSRTRKANVRKRLKAVDDVIKTVSESGVQLRSLELARMLPKEYQMEPRDKYTIFSRIHTRYRKGIHKVPHFTKVPVPRTSPPGF